MGLKSVLCAKIEMKADKDVFHDVFTNKPHHVSTMSPLHIQNFELLEGGIGIVGSKICWNYTLGKQNNLKCPNNPLEQFGSLYELDIDKFMIELSRTLFAPNSFTLLILTKNVIRLFILVQRIRECL